ncbi:Ig-like domain-containing protein, partial [Candidatus Kaiserbacteria bacterium]|nr:Ig-like domain-containing protein [Candidatus Kaiserbacteria bacterium]
NSYTFDVNPDDGENVAVTIQTAADVAIDAAENNNTASNQLEYTSDTVGPVTSVTAPAGGGSYNGDIEITADAEDASDIERVEFWHSSTDTLISTDTEAPYTATWDSTDTAEGSHSIYVKAYDNAGNVSTSDSVSVTLDQTAPAVAITAPAADARVNGATMITFTDDESTAPECSVDGENWSDCAPVDEFGEPLDMTLGDIDGFDELDEGDSFTLYLRDIDTAGNEGTDEVALVKDTSSPSVESHDPTTNEVGVDPEASVSVVFDEAVVVETGDVTFSPAISGFTIENSETDTVTINPDSDLDDNTTYTVTLSGVTDTAGNIMDNYEWSFTTSASYSIPLTLGWNLISLPVVPGSTDIEDVLGDLDDDTKIASVYAYNAVTDTWTVYHPGSPETSDLSTMTAGYGYWIDYIDSASASINGAGNLFLEGNTVPPQRNLANGWNLIGYYQLENTTSVASRYALATLFDGANDETNKLWTQLRTYDNSGKTFKPAIGFNNEVNPGEGFWIFMNNSKIYGPGIETPDT